MDTAIRSGCTCITCRLVFASVELQRQHYSSEWHRYNVKRQIAELPPITEEQFAAKIQAHQETEAENDKKKRRTKKQKKQQQAKGSSSDEDQEMEDGSGDVEDEEEDDYDENNAIPSTECLFCSATSTSFDDNLLHMSKQHGFFIPDSNYCSDVEGLINYLGLKIGAGNYCIHCPNKRFRDLNSCQLHMRDKSHCQFSVEGDKVVEYLDYYDYGELLQEGDGEDGDDAAINMGYSLVLPSGTTLGHRALMRYYKQRLPENQPEKLGKSARRLQQNQIKALGWTGTSGPVAVQRARDFKFMQNVMKRTVFRRELHGNKLFKSRGRDDQM